MITWEYLAGFIDGEGSIKSYRMGYAKALRPRITIGQKTREVLDQIQLFLGTSRTITLSRGCYYLQLQKASDLKRILDGILPHLIVKRVDALAALDLVNEILARGDYRLGQSDTVWPKVKEGV